jgi:hypothetical protein
MYPEISPSLKLRETISHPIRSEEVIGFLGRNTKLGGTAIVMKEAAVSESIDGRRVFVPDDSAEKFAKSNSELVVLLENEVFAMMGTDFEEKCLIKKRKYESETIHVPEVSLNSICFRRFSRSEVDVSN